VNDVRAHPRHPTPPEGTPPPLGSAVDGKKHPDPTVLAKLHRDMLASRIIEERIVDLYRLGKITGGCYTGIGNEATSVGCASALETDDVLLPTHRDMGSHVVRGHALADIMRQYFKKETSQSGGKDSGLHLGREGSNIVGMISHLAHMMPVAVGVALADRQQGKDTAVLTTVGDGATSLGDFHEALNFAAVQKLPVLFVIENNQYAYSTPITLQYAAEKLADRAIGYGMRGARIDGTDAIETYSAAREAIVRGRRGEGPTLLECVTMRMRGHSEHDDFKYVPASLLEAWKTWDPIARLERYLIERRISDAAAIEGVRRSVASEVDRAVEDAERDPPPDPASADRDVFRLWRDEWTVR
jgi:TPP-dependent pyruvate/acetoin dehydrogenase alpha subunit